MIDILNDKFRPFRSTATTSIHATDMLKPLFQRTYWPPMLAHKRMCGTRSRVRE